MEIKWWRYRDNYVYTFTILMFGMFPVMFLGSLFFDYKEQVFSIMIPIIIYFFIVCVVMGYWEYKIIKKKYGGWKWKELKR